MRPEAVDMAGKESLNMINIICLIITMIGTTFFYIQGNFIFLIIEHIMMVHYALSALEWLKNTYIRGSNREQDEDYEQKLLENQERENWHPRKDTLYLNSLDLKDIDWTKKEQGK